METGDYGGKSMKAIVTTLLLGLSLLTSLVIEQSMKSAYTTELAFIIIGIVIMAGVLFGLWVDAEWSYALSTLLFAAALANIIWLFTQTSAFLTLTFGVIVNVSGLVICLISTERDDWPSIDALETYDLSGFEIQRPAKKTKRKKRR